MPKPKAPVTDRPAPLLTATVLGALLCAAVLGGCAVTGATPPSDDSAADTLLDEPWQTLPKPTHTLENFIPGATPEFCFDRENQPYTAVVDAHLHPRPFGGPAIEPEVLLDVFERSGVRFVNFFGIGQILELDANCNYYLDCPGVTAEPSIKNDFVNGMTVAALDPDAIHITLSMTFMDLANPDRIVEMIELYDREFPGMFSWSGELNLIKQALIPNNHEPATEADIDAWAPFMAILQARGIPVTLHSDLGNNADPTKFLHLIHHAAETYPDNKIVWAHMGLSKELSTMSPAQHVRIMTEAFEAYPNLMVDISWDVLWNEYHQWGEVYLPFFEKYSTRILPGTDFVAAGYKDPIQYVRELEVTSRALASLSDEAFRNIALGQNYFNYLNLGFQAPPLCKTAP